MRRLCRAPNCATPISSDHFYCRRDHDALLDGLLRTTERAYKEGALFYVGRTHFPEQRLLQQRVERNLTHLAVLHWAGDQEETAWLEERLMREYHQTPKSRNRSLVSEGYWAGMWNAVYVAWRPKAKASTWRDEAFVPVEYLDFGRRLVPDRSRLLREPDLLMTSLGERQAISALEAVGARWKSPRLGG